MERKPQNRIIYTIAATVLLTICIQVYWNIKNYGTNKLQVLNDVQTALDNSVDFYYTDLAKTTVKTIDTQNEIFNEVGNNSEVQVMVDSIIKSTINEAKDSIQNSTDADSPPGSHSITRTFGITPGLPPEDRNNVEALATKIVISLINGEIDFKKFSTDLTTELTKRGFDFKYVITHSRNGKVLAHYGNTSEKKLPLSVQSQSAYLPEGTILKLQFPDITSLALQKGFLSILLSFLLSASIIASLLYLLRVINRQKQVAEIKNDFMSNISHELKTPITISLSANEAILRFNKDADTTRTEKFIDISNQQLHKLNLIVEKILETAVLDTDQLTIKKEKTDLVKLLRDIVEKQQMNTPKKIDFSSTYNAIDAHIDRFHFENVVANVIENAIKYGGDIIEVALSQTSYTVSITIADNGTPIEKGQREKIFDKFYRIPKKNIHDTKGFGIGLYYAREIMQKHLGNLEIVPDLNKTIFKITMPWLIK
ncbi:sensor histidine kinase [Flavobacterium cerinum]|uniref:histidine kinase n=1 Tax=Flavobacterium cerinum TaxID=2502784 RepID=A0A3S3TVV1_9FLAO|nr:HAMP domain-containing sensor histidine kinase [Flavobacterium cerinum]RWW96722.1 HAMP domain-containing histidine kinase [Flavobacterium cerinum]